MGMKPYVSSRIIVDVSDRVISPLLTVKQRAVYRSLLQDYDDNDEPFVLIGLQLVMYAQGPNNSYGPELVGEGFSVRPKTLRADNLALVDASDPAAPNYGNVLAIKGMPGTENWQAVLDSFPQNTRLQGNHYEYIRDNESVITGAQIRKHIGFADAIGLFA